MNEHKKTCIVCEQDSSLVPLIRFVFKEEEAWICPQHLPILIHKPEELAGKLPGAENLRSAAGDEQE